MPRVFFVTFCLLSVLVLPASIATPPPPPPPPPTTIPCLMGEKVHLAKNALAPIQLKINDGPGSPRNPTPADDYKRIKTQDKPPNDPVPAAPYPAGYAVVVELYPAGSIQPTVVPCLKDETVAEAVIRLGDMPLKIATVPQPTLPADWRDPIGADNTSLVQSQFRAPGDQVGTRPLAAGDFVGVILFPNPPPQQQQTATVPCVVGDNVYVAKVKLVLGGSSLKISDASVVRDPTSADDYARISTQDLAPGSVASPAGPVTVTLYPRGDIKPTVVPCLVGDTVGEAILKLGDIPLVIHHGNQLSYPIGEDDTRKVISQENPANEPVPRPLPPGYFVSVTL